ncbi:MAG: LiaI-LiaF-like domain-containing protein [Anaerolineae bacterium]
MEKRGSIIGGLVLIGVGVFFLLMQFFPGLANIFNLEKQWPLIIVAIGLVFWLSAILGTPPLTIPGTIVGGIGGILYYQNISGNWASWAYVWALIPAFVGMGMVAMSVLGEGGRHARREGGRLVVIGLGMFVIFGAFFTGLGSFGRLWPVFLILAGGFLLLKNSLARR